MNGKTAIEGRSGRVSAGLDYSIAPDRYDGAIEGIFDLQDKVASTVVGAISPKMEQPEIEGARRKATENLDAYDYDLQGIARVYQTTNNAKVRRAAAVLQCDRTRPQLCIGLRHGRGMLPLAYDKRLNGGPRKGSQRSCSAGRACVGVLARRTRLRSPWVGSPSHRWSARSKMERRSLS